MTLIGMTGNEQESFAWPIQKALPSSIASMLLYPAESATTFTNLHKDSL